MKLLVLAYPTYGRTLHLNSSGEFVVLAPDEMIKILSELGWQVDVVNLSPFQTDKPLMRSKKTMKVINDIDITKYDLCWHMLRDPTQPEVLDIVTKIGMECRVINNVMSLKGLYKHNYLATLYKHGIGPRVYSKNETTNIKWENHPHGVKVCQDRKLISVYNYNNNRGDYKERELESHVVVEYLDSSEGGVRSFIRIGYANGTIVGGFKYSSPDTLISQKSGTCPFHQAHVVEDRFHQQISSAMFELGVDVAHLEGCYVNGELKFFDINPYPTSYGNTLGVISLNICRKLAETIS